MRPGFAAPVEPLIGHRAERCVECWGCVRHCPARALRIVDGRSEVVEERCVRCGVCVTACGNSAHTVRDDLPRVRELLGGDRPVVALLASEHVAALHPLTPAAAERALESIGFAGVETTVLGEELVAAAYEQVHGRAGNSLPRLRSTCAVAVDWVLRFYPELTGALVPAVPPYIAQARLARSLYPTDVAIVYVSPCWSRKDEIHEPDFAGAVDVAIGFDELLALLADAPVTPGSPSRGRRPRAVKQLATTDGFPRRTLTTRDLTNTDVVKVRGLADLDRLLAAVVRGETAPDVIDMLNCEGCIDGPCVNPELSVYAKRTLDEAERQRQPAPMIDSRTFLSALPAIEITRSFTARPAPVVTPTSAEIDAVLAAGEFLSREETIDCGACGYDTCVEHAVAIWLEHSSWEQCLPLQKRLLTREHEALVEVASSDPLTGLANRRALDARLAEEVARVTRYGAPLSFVMLDLDGFKGINDQHGHGCGDDLLRGTGVMLRATLRATDFAARYGGDEFALILPATTKTEAWAVAEKVADAFRHLSVTAPDGSAVSTTASVGVAAFGGVIGDGAALLQAADNALYRAKRAGRNRVELAQG